MPQIRPNIETFARIKVIGVGGSGQNAVDHMIESHFDGVEYICLNTDTQHLHHSKAPRKIHIGKNLTRGVGTGMNPDTGAKAAEETKAEIQEVLKDTDMVFVACGMGGGTGTGAAPVVARLAKEQGILTIGVVTRPFSFEGEQRISIAREGIEQLQKEVDALIVISNDRLLAITDRNTSFRQAFAMCDDILLQAVKSIADIIKERQTINIDYADIKVVLSNAGTAYVGIGIATGENRAEEAANMAINSPLLDVSISGAKGVLLAIATHADDLKIFEVDTIARIVGESIDQRARFVFGPLEDSNVKKGELQVTVVATGFDSKLAPVRPSVGKSTSVPVTTGEQQPVQNQNQSPAHAEQPTVRPVIVEQQTASAGVDEYTPPPARPAFVRHTEPEPVPAAEQPRPVMRPTMPQPAFASTMPDRLMPNTAMVEPESLDDTRPIEVLDDSEDDTTDINGWNAKFPAFIRRSK